jgi:hypothetical protein
LSLFHPAGTDFIETIVPLIKLHIAKVKPALLMRLNVWPVPSNPLRDMLIGLWKPCTKKTMSRKPSVEKPWSEKPWLHVGEDVYIANPAHPKSGEIG